MTKRWAYGGVAIAVLVSATIIGSTVRTAGEITADERTLREYAGAWRWSTEGFVYLQLWNEFAGVNELVAYP